MRRTPSSRIDYRFPSLVALLRSVVDIWPVCPQIEPLLRWELLLFCQEHGRKPCCLGSVIWSQLAIDYETEEIIFEWP
jgi:hypothetical protein